MKNRWSENKANIFVKKYGKKWGKDLALRTYASRLIGSDKDLVIHGGGNTSVKTSFTNVFGQRVPAIYVKASGYDLSTIEPSGHSGLMLDYLQELRVLKELSDEELVNEMRTHLFFNESATPSMETLLHAFIPEKYVDHTHASAILTLTNRPDGKRIIREVYGNEVVVVDYKKPGFGLSIAAAKTYNPAPSCKGMILMKHGLLTWGKKARDSYKQTIDLVTKAEKYISREIAKKKIVRIEVSDATLRERYLKIAPLLRQNLVIPTNNADWPLKTFVLRPLFSSEILSLIGSSRGKEMVLTPPLLTDYVIRTKPFPLWIENPSFNNYSCMKKEISSAISSYKKEYEAYFKRNSARLKLKMDSLDPLPRVIVVPELGVICAGKDVREADVVKDITSQTLAVKYIIDLMGTYEGLSENHLFDMEYSCIQHRKIDRKEALPLQRSVALITGGAGAIGWGISQELLENGCHVAVCDLPGESLDLCVNELKKKYGSHVLSIEMDVTDPLAIHAGFDRIIQTWGGIDLVVANAGIAHVSSIADMDPRDFFRLEAVNTHGTLLTIAEAARFFKVQGIGGDIILISTKNVFAPGARFGAYSATKAAAHQLARIASLELAEMGVRVNAVSPDAVFAHRKKKSGLWQEVGPDRMLARGLDEKGLETYYRERNLLKAKVTATHVARSVLFFATHQTPTTGATIPVDGGLPDATPR